MKLQSQAVGASITLLLSGLISSCEKMSYSHEPAQHEASPNPASTQAAASVPCESATPSTGVTVIEIPQGATGRGPEAFGTNPTVVSAGTTVIWKNNDTVDHELHTEDDQLNTGILKPGQCYSHRFPTTGTFTYHCHLHGEQSESGSIEVAKTD
jgi:plastocyanin